MIFQKLILDNDGMLTVLEVFLMDTTLVFVVHILHLESELLCHASITEVYICMLLPFELILN